MFDKHIYVLREPRCGGSFLSSYIGSMISKTHGLSLNNSNFTDSHNFGILNSISRNPDAFIIRIDRRNITEHFLSIQAATSVGYRFTNLTPEYPTHPMWDRIKNSKITIEPVTVRDYVQGRIKTEVAYLTYIHTHNIPNTRIWYEDAFAGSFDIPELDLYGLDPTNEKDAVATFKLPDYKHDVFVNYDQVSNWIERYKNAYIKKYNLEEFLEHWTSDTSC